MAESTLDMVTRRRHMVRCVLRGFIVAASAAVAFWFLCDFLFKLPYGWQTILDRPFYTFREHLAFGGAVLIVGASAWWLQHWIARVIVPIPRLECPQCGYALQKLTTARCPECGLMFGSAPSREQSASGGT